MLAAWGLFSLVDTSVKWLSVAGLPALQLAFMRFGTHFALSSGPMLREGRAVWAVPVGTRAMLILRGALLCSATVANFLALQHLDLAVVAALTFAAPVVVCALSGPLLGERVGPWRWGAIGLGFVGVLIIVRPWGEAIHPAILYSCYVPFALASFSILTRKLAGRASNRTMQAYVGTVGVVALLPAAIWVWEAPSSVFDWTLMLGFGAFAWVGHNLFGEAHAYAPASVLMPFSYTFLIYMAGMGWLVFGTMPDGATAIGATVIAASGLVIWWRETRTATPDAASVGPG